LCTLTPRRMMLSVVAMADTELTIITWLAGDATCFLG
jgi:hypothetical protein